MEGTSNIKLERTIGSGTFGKVKRAVYLPTGHPLAVKILNKHKIVSKKDVLRIEREITILKRVNHPNLLKLYQLIITPKHYLLVTQIA
jgi:5'-AMP-activated protein kinase, catalytic alpha subunit